MHVPDTAGALAVLDFEVEGGGGQKARRLLDLLGEKLWPGELLHAREGRAGGKNEFAARLGTDGAAMPRLCIWCQIINTPEIFIFVVVSNATKERSLTCLVVVKLAVHQHRTVGGGVGDIGRHA